MSHTPRERAQLIASIAKKAQHAQIPTLAAYIGAYFQGVDPADLAKRSAQSFSNIAHAHWQLAAQRSTDEDIVKVFNPTTKQHGFESEHTVVMIACADRPFLVDSVSMAITQMGLAIHLIVHPVLSVERNLKGKICGVGDTKPAATESWQYIEIDREFSQQRIAQLQDTLKHILKEVQYAVEDWQAMRQRLLDSINDPQAHLTESQRHFLHWMYDDHFTFVGVRDYTLEQGAHEDKLIAEPRSGLGIFRSQSKRPSTRIFKGAVRDQVRSQNGLIITKANAWSRIHRHAHLDYVGIKLFNTRGKVVGERRFLGLWTSTAYHQSLASVPMLRDTAQHIIDHFGLSAQSHDGKAISHVLETFPRDELLQASAEELIPTIRGVVNLYDRRMTRVFSRRDPFGRFWSLLIYIPRDRYNTEVRERVEQTIRERLHAIDIQSQIELSDSPLARLYLIVRGDSDVYTLDNDELEHTLADVILNWRDRLRVALLAAHTTNSKNVQSNDNRAHWFQKYSDAFPTAYKAENSAQAALADIEVIEQLRQGSDRFHLSLHTTSDGNSHIQLRLISSHEPLAISDSLPALENFGLRLVNEHPYKITNSDQEIFWIQNLSLRLSQPRSIDWHAHTEKLLAAIRAVWLNHADNDALNRLVLSASLDWRECVLVRAACRWLIQIGLPYSLGYMAQVLEQHANITRHAVAGFINRHHPSRLAAKHNTATAVHERAVTQGLSTLTRLDEDRILSGLVEFLNATLRTNYFQKDATGQPKKTLSLKINPSQVKGVPEPKPYYEVWVHSPQVEGVHLRKGPVARGGLRWSDRYEDFRTEILGLVKAQHVKNTLIVPVGAKGGFVCRQLPSARDHQAAVVKACYQDFIRALLDLTDNIVNQKIAPPKQLNRLDGDDPYLVVAADKGTATFSDTANALSEEYHFWLGDAFASGGSKGYDHKKMAITARGAWECVVRHFRELNITIGTDLITVAGIGDMSGDVFGNGLLYSPQLALVAAFNHQHIFIDPHPDPKKSFQERQRLFNLPRSSWEDYNSKLISTGGGIYNRTEKSLNLSKEACKLLNIQTTHPTPNEVIQAILKLDVDLLWNGGIGTYVKAKSESHAEAGDRANDAVRINGCELRAKVIGEGGNLGLTQLGRIEAAKVGVKLNTDFIDNSAGVNCSDVEVNIKILLTIAKDHKMLSDKERDRLLVSMTDDVAQLVLRNNYLQSQALSVLEQSAVKQVTAHSYVLKVLETQGELSRSIEFMPSDSQIQERAQQNQGLTRPELAVLLSYSKIWLYNHLLSSNLPEDPALAYELNRYFPVTLQKRFASLMLKHPLKREIITTATVNSLINRMGPVFAIRTSEDTGHDLASVTRAYIIARDVMDIRACWGRIDSLDSKIPATVQYEMLAASTAAVAQATHWLLSFEKGLESIANTLKRLHGPLVEFFNGLLKNADPLSQLRIKHSIQRLQDTGVPGTLAQEIASLNWLTAGLNVVSLAHGSKRPVAVIADTYFKLSHHLSLQTLLDRIDVLKCEHHWAEVARDGLREECQRLHRDLTAMVLMHTKGSQKPSVESVLPTQAPAVTHFKRVMNDIEKQSQADFSILSIAIKNLRSLSSHHSE